MNLEELKVVDADVAAAIEAELDRQNSHIELIASENWVFTDAAGGKSNAADVSVRSQDMVKTAPNFGYYQVISTVVPENVTTVTVYLEATGGTDDSVILDDVSLTVV